ncbi:hypothetical protein GW17_00048255 [Ensete ventricosum]|nr:hypothetical protein GW17_00048255 [Ensete ventricosum]
MTRSNYTNSNLSNCIDFSSVRSYRLQPNLTSVRSVHASFRPFRLQFGLLIPTSVQIAHTGSSPVRLQFDLLILTSARSNFSVICTNLQLDLLISTSVRSSHTGFIPV